MRRNWIPRIQYRTLGLSGRVFLGFGFFGCKPLSAFTSSGVVIRVLGNSFLPKRAIFRPVSEFRKKWLFGKNCFKIQNEVGISRKKLTRKIRRISLGFELRFRVISHLELITIFRVLGLSSTRVFTTLLFMGHLNEPIFWERMLH